MAVRSLENLENLEMSGDFILVRENLENLEKSGDFVEITQKKFFWAFLTYSPIEEN